MIDIHFDFKAPVWKCTGKGAWHFVTLPQEEAEQVREFKSTFPDFGTVKVKAKVGATTWSTSLFPDTSTNSYLLPVKADVRRKEKIVDGDELDISLDFCIDF